MDWSGSTWYAKLPPSLKKYYEDIDEKEKKEEYQYDREKGIALLWEEIEYLYDLLREANIPVKTWQERSEESKTQEFEENPWKN
jgi:hypothetical protein